ncbi:MAG: glycoside hydrolase family 25 protein [Oscillospiraceae bacterium]|nr:glycoside hydrolase family 25 protein [Oscillospiraceae bacterium]
MKNFLLIVLFIILIFSCVSCAVISGELFSETESSITDLNGQVIPVYEDVDLSVFDPELFSLNDNGRMVYNDSSVKFYTGIDVSVFQGDIDFEAVKNDGIDFVMLRAAFRGYGPSGVLGTDANFITNYEKAVSAGLKVGVYFFSQAVNADEALEEASYVLDLIKDLDISYPVAYDWERIDYDTARTDEIDNETITSCAVAFCNAVSNAGYVPVIYFNKSLGYFSYNLSRVNNYDFWLAEYGSAPSFIYNYKIWQYTENGAVDGINGSVDINISLTDFSKSESAG